MKKLSYLLGALLLFIIGCRDEGITPSNEKAEPEITSVYLNGTPHQVSKLKTIKTIVKENSFTIKTSFYTAGEPNTMFFFDEESKLEEFVKLNYPDYYQSTYVNRQEDSPVDSQSRLSSTNRTNGYEDWTDFQIVGWNDGNEETTLNSLEATNHFSWLWDDEAGEPFTIDFTTPSNGYFNASLYWGEYPGDQPTFGPAFAPKHVYIPPGTWTTVANYVYNSWGDGARAKSIVYNPSRVPSDKIFAAFGGNLNSIERSNGASSTFLTGMSGVSHSASIGNTLYVINNGTLTKINPYNGATSTIQSGWSGTEVFAASYVGSTPHVYGVVGGQIKKRNLSNGQTTSLGSGWSGTQAMTATTGWIFAVWGDVLYRISATNGATSVVEPAGWNGTEAMTLYNGYIYAVQGGTLWKTNPNGSGSVSLGGSWWSTQDITYNNGMLYILKGGNLYEVNPSNGASSGPRGSLPGLVTATAIIP